MKVSRRINWISSKQEANLLLIQELENGLKEFYSRNPDYYADINFTEHNWVDKEQKGYGRIVEVAKGSQYICEVGCGSANILKYYPELTAKYSGCDFSHTLMNLNSKQYTAANFTVINQPNLLPYPDNSFDFVFSTFVLEHSTNPALFLKECTRILKNEGTLIILCPDFLSVGKCSSQRAGFSAGTASQKLKNGKFIDALITLWDNRIKVPYYCRKFKQAATTSPQFYINLSPTVFTDPFLPDVDAVYVTYKHEIINELSQHFYLIENADDMSAYEAAHKLIFLELKKNLKQHSLCIGNYQKLFHIYQYA